MKYRTRFSNWPKTPLLVVFLLIVGAAQALAENRPNIVFLMSDDQTCYSLGCYGNDEVQTPNIDQLAAEGMRFENHYVTTAICMASRATAMTGMYEHKTGCNFNHGPLLEDKWQLSYPILLRKAGYTTAFAGKFGFVVSKTPRGKSRLPESDFDTWGGGPGQTHYETRRNASMQKYAKEFPHATLSYGAFSRDFIQQASQSDAPFCLSISFKAPHRPVTPDPKFDHIYAGKTFTKPDNFGRGKGSHFSLQSRQGRQYDRFYSWGYADKYDEVMAKYHQQCYAIDAAVGMIRKALEDAGVADNTVVIYTSDNGFLCGSHGYGSKVLPYEESTHVPLIVFDPRSERKESVKGGRRSEALTGNIDFAPTILKLAGLEPPDNMDGADLMPLYESPDSEIHESLMLMNAWGPASNQSLAVVTKKRKYIYWYFAAEDKGFGAAEELYDLQRDPGELHNAAEDSASAADLNRLRSLYDSSVQQLQKTAVKHHRYEHYGRLFDRHIDWKDKAPLIGKVDQGKGG